MSHADFVHLRVHSSYSLSEGAIKADKIAALAREAAMPAVAIADSGNLFGSLEFSQACAARGVQPIIGCQIALRRPDNARLPPDPIVLLAQTPAGLANLQRLSSFGFLETEPGQRPQLPWARRSPAARYRPSRCWRWCGGPSPGSRRGGPWIRGGRNGDRPS